MIQRIRQIKIDDDEYGNPVYGEPTRRDLEDAFTAPRMSDGLNSQERSGVVIGLDLFVPFGTDLVYTDQVDIGGVVWELDGEPEAWEQPMTGWEAGMVAHLTRGEG